MLSTLQSCSFIFLHFPPSVPHVPPISSFPSFPRVCTWNTTDTERFLSHTHYTKASPMNHHPGGEVEHRLFMAEMIMSTDSSDWIVRRWGGRWHTLERWAEHPVPLGQWTGVGGNSFSWGNTAEMPCKGTKQLSADVPCKSLELGTEVILHHR